MSPEQFTALIGALGALVTAIAGLIVAVTRLYAKVEENRKAINGRVDDMVATARVAGHAEGVVLGQQLANPPVEPVDDTT